MTECNTNKQNKIHVSVFRTLGGSWIVIPVYHPESTIVRGKEPAREFDILIQLVTSIGRRIKETGGGGHCEIYSAADQLWQQGFNATLQSLRTDLAAILFWEGVRLVSVSSRWCYRTGNFCRSRYVPLGLENIMSFCQSLRVWSDCMHV